MKKPPPAAPLLFVDAIEEGRARLLLDGQRAPTRACASPPPAEAREQYVMGAAAVMMRAGEALGIRIKDINFSTSPTKVHIRKEFSKTRVARNIYVSDEATKYLKDWISWKYRVRKRQEVVRDDIKKQVVVRDDDIIFQVQKNSYEYAFHLYQAWKRT